MILGVIDEEELSGYWLLSESAPLGKGISRREHTIFSSSQYSWIILYWEYCVYAVI